MSQICSNRKSAKYLCCIIAIGEVTCLSKTPLKNWLLDYMSNSFSLFQCCRISSRIFQLESLADGWLMPWAPAILYFSFPHNNFSLSIRSRSFFWISGTIFSRNHLAFSDTGPLAWIQFHLFFLLIDLTPSPLCLASSSSKQWSF